MKTKLFLTLLIAQSAMAEINLEQFTSLKLNEREAIMSRGFRIGVKSLPNANDRAEDFVDDSSKMIRNLEKMDSLKLTAKTVTVTPWSDNYWPIAEGLIANRYTDPKTKGDDWVQNNTYFTNHPTEDLIKARKFDVMSPAEKYDYVLDLSGDTLTRFSWSEGEKYQNQFNKVESWMGICHGWSIASIMMPNPVKKVVVKSPRNESVTFYPSDIKALGSLLWAQTQFPTRFIGGRCNDEKPMLDSMGRPKNPDCLDDNPATWHMIVVNQIGVFNRSFVMDATYNYEVWNQPVYGYKYVYTNVQTNKRAKTLEEALVPVESFTNDARKSVRSPGTKYIVGVTMAVRYVSETEPNIYENQESLFTDVTYSYDLELDAKKNIIGGEWKSKEHPDFLWTVDVGTFPKTYGDSQVSKIDLSNIPAAVKNYAGTNAKGGIPFGPFVRELFSKSALK